MISRADGACPVQFPAVYSPGLWIFYYLICCFSIVFTACGSQPLSSNSYVLENVTLFTDNSSISGRVGQNQSNVYTLDARQCSAEGMMMVVALETGPADTLTSYDLDVQYLLAINTQRLNPFSHKENGTIMAYTGIRSPTLDSCKPFTQLEEKITCRQSYAFVRIQLTEASIDTLPWYVGVSSVGGSVNFSLKAWCLETEALPQEDPEPSKLCVKVGTAGCSDVRDNVSCVAAENITPTSKEGSARIDGLSLESGEWKYFTFDVLENNTRILVEMSRSHGDVMLFLKPEGTRDAQGALPSEFDIDEYADKSGYQNRLSYHHYFFIGTGKFYVGIYNNDACVEEVSHLNLTISTASQQSTSKLCPMNCSYPNGMCISDNVCQCEDGYGGGFCEGSLESPKSYQKISGQLFPGQVAYFRIKHVELSAHNEVSIKFSRNGSNTILLAKGGGFPTLANYSLKFTDHISDGNLSYLLEEFNVGPEAFSGGDLIFAVFNVDYIVHQISFYDITVILPGGKSLSSWVILLVAISSSLLVCCTMVIFKTALYRSNRQNMDQVLGSFNLSTAGENVLNSEGGLGKAVIERFPLLFFEEGVLPKERAQCSICLGDYVAGEVLRKIPLCYHIFHVDCIDKWLLCNSSCPLCRVMLVRLNERQQGGLVTEATLRMGGT